MLVDEPRVASGRRLIEALPQLAVVVAVAALALLQAWASRSSMQSDGISYLDMGDAILRGDFAMALNGYWSPVYPFLLGLALRLFQPDPAWQFPLVHLVNFAIFLFALASLAYWLRAKRSFPLAYAIFGFLALNMIGMERVSPDLLMAAFLFLCLGKLARIERGEDRLSSYLILGALCGFGYLVKAPMLPVAIVIACLAVRRTNIARRSVAIAIPFVLIAGPWIAAVSIHSGRLIVSDNARVNFIAQINGASPGWYFQSPGTARGNYIHPVRRIYDRPAVYEFATPLGGTQPIWYDPSYWTAGVSPRIVPVAWARGIVQQIRTYARLLIRDQWLLIAGFIALAAIGRWPRWADLRDALRGARSAWILALAGLAMYALVVVEPRYVAWCFTMLWIPLFAGVRAHPRRNSGALAAILICCALLASLSFSVARDFRAGSHRSDDHLQLADLLRSRGIHAGCRVARIGGRYAASWARLLGAKVVAEVPESDAAIFWKSEKSVQDGVMSCFRGLDVCAVVAECVDKTCAMRPGNGWVSGGSDRFLVLTELAKPAAGAQ
jgi:hypothetical protein